MTQDANAREVYPDRDHRETTSIARRLAAIIRGHRPDPADPEHRCLCGFDGENYDDHAAWETLREMKDVGYEVWPTRH
jgi:hypothetical protein